jgi:hypothetical protein
MLGVFGLISAVSAVSALFRQSSANGDGDGENDRKERFHGNKYSLLPARVRLSDWSSRLLLLAVGRRPTCGNSSVTFPTRRAAWIAAILRA